MNKTEYKVFEKRYSDYINSNYYTLEQAYKKPSDAKCAVWERCREKCAYLNGSGLKIVYNGNQMMSVGFTYWQNNREYFCYITKFETLYYRLP